jgi:hypothetical protein
VFETCVGGTCVGCPPGQVQCGNSCVDTDIDDAHCGGCNAPCPPAADGGCVGGVCVCANGDTLCGALCVDTDASEQHCGMCNNPCPGAPMCVMGACM